MPQKVLTSSPGEKAMKIPKFRVTGRISTWFDKHGHGDLPNGRLPSEIEEVFFKSKEDAYVIAQNVADYAHYVGRLELRFEKLMVGHPDAAFNYLTNVRHDGGELNPELLNTLKGHGGYLVQWSKIVASRLPPELEDTLKDADARYAYQYAKEVLCGRLPEHLEDVFFKDETIAARYAFDVIRGFSSVMLPEALHSFMILKSYENPNNSWVKSYVEASENDPNKTGNRKSIG